MHCLVVVCFLPYTTTYARLSFCFFYSGLCKAQCLMQITAPSATLSKVFVVQSDSSPFDFFRTLTIYIQDDLLACMYKQGRLPSNHLLCDDLFCLFVLQNYLSYKRHSEILRLEVALLLPSPFYHCDT